MFKAYRPPQPKRRSPIAALLHGFVQKDRDLLSLLPSDVYTMRVGKLGASRRGILFVNDADLIKDIMGKSVAIFPKNDLFVGALEPLVGNGVFISNGDAWKKQRQMIEPSFSHIQIARAFETMKEAATAMTARLSKAADAGHSISLDEAMTEVTADVMCRAIFSTSLDSQAAREIYEDFEIFQRHVANVEVARLIFGKPFSPVHQPTEAKQACERIRMHLRDWLSERLVNTDMAFSDIANDLINARAIDDGSSFTLEDLVDQAGVFFLAGHETTASTLTWALFVLSQMPDLAAALQQEIDELDDIETMSPTALKNCRLLQSVLFETLRFYPPGAFLPRVCLERCKLDKYTMNHGAMIMISPWIMHHHPEYWEAPELFKPERFLHGSDKTNPAYMPFGLGPRTCIGGGFATVEGLLILSQFLRHFTVKIDKPEDVMPAVRLTLRPKHPIQASIAARA